MRWVLSLALLLLVLLTPALGQETKVTIHQHGSDKVQQVGNFTEIGCTNGGTFS